MKKTVENKEYGATVWTLANGTQIVVKPTKFKADEVRMNAQSKGGLSILSDAEYYMGEMMPAVSSMSAWASSPSRNSASSSRANRPPYNLRWANTPAR